jgi:4-methyl-5(b-hydroxyethyl)-thiazole monophosphate biosynthesis
MASVLIVLAPGCEEIETVTVADVLVRAGQDVTIASVAKTLHVIGSRGIPLGAHVAFDTVATRDFDLVYLPGGKGSAEICRDDARIQALAQRQLAAGRHLAVICAAPIALVPHGLHRGRRLTSFPGVRDQLAGATWLDQPVVEDGNLITSQGAGTAMVFALTLARTLAGADVAATVARQMIATPI